MWMGDDDATFGYPVPTQCLLSDAYAAARSGLISDAARLLTAAPGDPCAAGLARRSSSTSRSARTRPTSQSSTSGEHGQLYDHPHGRIGTGESLFPATDSP